MTFRANSGLFWPVVMALFCIPAGATASLIAQVEPAIGSLTRPFDATNLHEPVELGIIGLVQVGDDPAYAQPGLDDSKWLPVDANTRPTGYFPQNEQAIIWRRLRIRVNPGETHLAMQAYYISRAFEVYVNGLKLLESGQVEPFVPYTRAARLIVLFLEAQLRTGSLVIAIRARAPRTWWTCRRA